MGRLNVTLCGILLDNPVIPASGTFGFGYEFADYYDINELGTFSFKGTTAAPRFGNPTPRIAETPSGMLNAVGLQNPGVDRVKAEELPKLKRVFSKPVMANVSGFSVGEYVEVVEKLDAEDEPESMPRNSNRTVSLKNCRHQKLNLHRILTFHLHIRCTYCWMLQNSIPLFHLQVRHNLLHRLRQEQYRLRHLRLLIQPL